jgi:threonine-phosphate decarboxylase
MMDIRPLHGGQLQQIAYDFKIPQAQLLDFSANINPEGPPASVLSSLRAALDNPVIIRNYPDKDEAEPGRYLAAYLGVRPENVAVDNGFVPLLDTAIRILNIRSCVVPVPAFVEYRRTLDRSRVVMIPHNLEADSGFNFSANDLSSKPCDAILLANPQNPSGALSSREEMLQIAEKALKRNIFVLLDEAFIDYCPEASLAPEINRFPNLIVFRSVTKFFGMAGLRVAYAAANAELCKQLRASTTPWSVTSLASLAAGIAVRDETYARRAITLNNVRRDQMHMAIENLGIHVYPSVANFLLLRLRDSILRRGLWARLVRNHHIVLRDCANYENLSDGFLRAAVLSESENMLLIEALAAEVANSQ